MVRRNILFRYIVILFRRYFVFSFRVKNLYKTINSCLFQHKRFAKNKPITYNALIRSQRIQIFQIIRGHYTPDRNDTGNPVDLLQFATYCFPPVVTKQK